MYQVKLFSSQRDIEEVIQDSQADLKLRESLIFAQEVLDYARAEQLNVGSSYSSYIDLGGRPVSYLVYAAQPLAFEPVTWWFPVVGEVRYLGFFDREDREKKLLGFEQKGFDVHRGQASAFSSLGWFDDPLYSTMVLASKRRISSILFHELTHRTAWVPGSSELNEQLATFVEHYLTVKFLKSKNLLEEVAHFEAYHRDFSLYYQWQQSLRRRLQLVYSEYAQKSMNEVEALHLKDTVIKDFLGAKRPKFEQVDFVGQRPWNNARLVASSLYSPDTSLFARAHACSKWKNMGEFLITLEKWSKSTENPGEKLHLFCSGAASFLK